MVKGWESKLFKKFPNKDRVKRIQELRRSNAATPERNEKKYSRKIRHAWKTMLRKGEY